MDTNILRKIFLDYFVSNNHQLVPSSSLIPYGDDSLLFVNAGMNQFKDVFLGVKNLEYTKATSAQKCIRAGGKHNDLENVGYTSRHHTFFEMLGNFSFGDYFKEKAIDLAWNFLLSVLKLDINKLYVTVHVDDDESYAIWRDVIGINMRHLIQIGNKLDGSSDNFWQMGDIGPCGYATEIFYDHGADVAGGPPGSNNEDGDRFVEIWNCVFMQYQKHQNGELTLLKRPSVDTGMGLERIAAVMQGVVSNYDIDIFQRLINDVAKLTHCANLSDVSLKVIADHIRSIAFLISENIIPANEGRGYVLRRIIRRAINHCYKLGVRKPLLYHLVDSVIIVMNYYTQLKDNREKIINLLYIEEEKFFAVISDGMKLLKQHLDTDVLSGKVAFTLYDTYGFPLDLTLSICREHNIKVDINMFNDIMSQQKEKSKRNNKFNYQHVSDVCVDTIFCGYIEQQCDAKVIGLYDDNMQSINVINNSGIVVTDKSVFYATSGGQVGDTGILHNESCIANVVNTEYINPGIIGHYVRVDSGMLTMGDVIKLQINSNHRAMIAANHTATHLLHAILRDMYGSNVQQCGSLVNEQYLRFDFSYDKTFIVDELHNIEFNVNQLILANHPVSTKLMPYNEAIDTGAIALFDEKYSDQVRVVSVGDNCSVELCCGTHVDYTGNIGCFIIISNKSIAGGVKRIEAVTGIAALKYIHSKRNILSDLCIKLKANDEQQLLQKLDSLTIKVNTLKSELMNQSIKLASSHVDELLNSDNYRLLNQDVGLLLTIFNRQDHKYLLSLIDVLKTKLKIAIIIFINQFDDTKKCIFYIYNVPNCSAKKLLDKVLLEIGTGKGGGNHILSQSVIPIADVTRLTNVINKVVGGIFNEYMC